MNDLQRRKTYVGRMVEMSYDRWRELGWSEFDATEMEKAKHTEPRVFVQVAPTHEGETGFEYPLAHHVLHSPDGFSWGYGGSGPSETARCILLDWFDLGHVDVQEQAFTEGSGRRDLVLPEGISYQDFKTEFLVDVPKDSFVIEGGRVGAWVRERVRV